MTAVFYIPLTIIVLSMFFVAYILGFRKIVYSIMIKEGMKVSKNVDSFKDYKSIYYVLKSNKKLDSYERKILLQHIIFTFISLLLWLSFVFVMFFTDW
jgi:hypothetical protein